MKSFQNRSGHFVWLLLYLIASCSIDHGIDPVLEVPTIKGKLIFTGEKPANTEGIVVVASRTFPPSDLVELTSTKSKILVPRSDTLGYEIVLPNFGSFAAVGAVWLGKDEPLTLSNVLGIYGVSLANGLSLPDTVTVTPEHPVAAGVDIVADYGRVTGDAFILGRIHYSGDWPANTQILAIAAFDKRPLSLPEFITNLRAINTPLPMNVSQFDYKLPVPTGTFGYIALLWLAQGADFADFKELGFYETTRGSGIPSAVTAAKGDTLRGVDLFIDFSQLDLD